MKKFTYLFVLILIFSCGGGGGGGGDGGGDPPPPSPPGSVTLTAPANGKVCETGTSTSDTKSNVDFSWQASSNTSTYDLQVTNLTTSSVVNKTGLTSTNTTVELDKGQPYIWKVISRTLTTQTGTSTSWKFYLAGQGIKNYAPFPAELKLLHLVQLFLDPMIKLHLHGKALIRTKVMSYILYMLTKLTENNHQLAI